MDHISYAIVIEEISRVCASTGVILVGAEFACTAIRFIVLERMSRRKNSWCRSRAAKKSAAMRSPSRRLARTRRRCATKAVRKGDTYVINGTKAWITNGGAADAAIVYVNTQPEKGEKGITALVVEKGTPGFRVGKEEKKLGIQCDGLHASFRSPIAKCRRRIASARKAKGTRLRFRRWMADASASRRRPRELRRAHSKRRWPMRKERQAFGHPIADFQAIQFMLADMATEIDAARLLAAAGGVEAGFRRAIFDGSGDRQAFRQRNVHARDA